jgi:hypothetical protein
MFNFQTGQGLSERTLKQQPVPVIVLDGAYCARPELTYIIDIAVLLQLDDQHRRTRLLAREGTQVHAPLARDLGPRPGLLLHTDRPLDSFDVVLTLH